MYLLGMLIFLTGSVLMGGPPLNVRVWASLYITVSSFCKRCLPHSFYDEL